MSNDVIDRPPCVGQVLNSQEWSTGMFDCLGDVKSCCFAYWCLPCFAGMTSRDFGEHICLPLLDIFGGCIPPITLTMRVLMRHRYGIKGSIPNDCVFSSFCCICTWCQMSREMQLRNYPGVVPTNKHMKIHEQTHENT